jgi:hypothetical protein
MCRWLMGVAVGLALLVPAPARGQTGGESLELRAGPVEVRDGYRMRVRASLFKGVSSGGQLVLSRLRDGVRQEHTYDFGEAMTLTIRRDLTGSLLRGDVPGLGRIDMRLTAPGAMRRPTLGPYCSGPRRHRRRGTLQGRLALTLDTGYFGTLRATTLPAYLTRTGDGARCSSGAFAVPILGLSADTQTPEQRMAISFDRLENGEVEQTFSVSTEHPAAHHWLMATGPRGSLTAPSSLSSANLTGAAPALSGGLTFKATAHDHDPPRADGAVEGDLVAHFDSIGDRRFPSGAAAHLYGPW